MEAALKKEVTQGLDVLEKKIVEEVSSKGISCWGWTLRISRNSAPLTPPKLEESLKPVSKVEPQSVPESV